MIHKISAGVGERLQYIAHRYNDTTIRFILKYPGMLDPNTLCAAAQAVVGSVDILHASYMPKSYSPYWQINTGYEACDYFSLVDCEGDPLKAANDIALQPVAHEAVCQMHVTQINGSDSCAVVVRISHLVADGGDGKYLLNKLAEGYRMIAETGKAESLSVKNGDRSPTCTYNKLSKQELFSLFKSPFSGVKTEYPFHSPDIHGKRRMLQCTIPADNLSAARQKAKPLGATVNDLLMTACYRSYAKTTGRRGAMSISALMDLRQHCKGGASEGLANMSGGLSTTLDFSDENSFADDLMNIAGQTAAAKNDPLAGLYGMPLLHMAVKAFPLSVLMRVSKIAYSSMSLNFTNLGNIPCAPLTMNGLVPVNGVFGGPLKLKPSVQVGTASFDGTAVLTILGDFIDEDIPSLQAFLDGIRTEIGLYLNEIP